MQTPRNDGRELYSGSKMKFIMSASRQLKAEDKKGLKVEAVTVTEFYSIAAYFIFTQIIATTKNQNDPPLFEDNGM